MTLITYLSILVFLIGIYFYAKYSNSKYTEGLTNNNQLRCPDLLIQKGSRFYLYTSKVEKVPGVNPIEFDTLEDYTEFLQWQKSQGIRCPVLYLQESYDAQGKSVYKMRPSVSEPQGGLPPSISSNFSNSPASVFPDSIANSSGSIIHESNVDTDTDNLKKPLAYPNPIPLIDATRNDPPYNKNSYPAYDPSNYYTGTTTPLDKMDIQQQNAVVSPNPMDDNWGGARYTQDLVDKGYYKENEVSIYVP
jgi:hypothetical protein